jgi:hypothetical protein
MKKIQINPALKRLSKADFTKWFKSRKELEGENLEERYAELHPKKEEVKK